MLNVSNASRFRVIAAITGEDKIVAKWSQDQGHVTGLIPEEASKVLGLIGDKAASPGLVAQLYVRNAPPPNYDAKKAQIWASIEAQRFQNSVEALGRIGDPALAEDILAKGQADLVGMARALRNHPKLGPSMLHKILIYAMGRGLEAEEQCMVDNITEASNTAEYRPAAIVDAIVSSPLFTVRGAAPPEPAGEEATP